MESWEWNVYYPTYWYDYQYGNSESDKYIVSLPIQWVILGKSEWASPLFGMQGVTFGYNIKRMLYELADHPELFDNIHGIVLEIQSPGWTIFGSQAISDWVTYYKQKTGNPVYAVIVWLGASGWYRSAVSADKVFADHGSLIWSIGVIAWPFARYNNVVEENGGIFAGWVRTTDGIDYTYLTAGEWKDFWNPHRNMTSKEKGIFQQWLDASYDEFVNHVAEARDIDPNFIKNTIWAYAYDNSQAKKYKLIDDTASVEEVYWKIIRDVTQKKDIPDSLQVVQMYESVSPFDQLLMWVVGNETQSSVQASIVSFCSQQASILAYYWHTNTLCQ